MHAATESPSVMQLHPLSTCSCPVHRSGFVPWWAHSPGVPSQARGPPAAVPCSHDESLRWIRSASANLTSVFLTVMLLLHTGPFQLYTTCFLRLLHVCVCLPVCESVSVIYLDVSLCGSQGMKASDWGDPSSEANCNCNCLFDSEHKVVMWRVHPLGADLVDLWPCTVLAGLWAMSWAQMYQTDWCFDDPGLHSHDLFGLMAIEPLILNVIPFQSSLAVSYYIKPPWGYTVGVFLCNCFLFWLCNQSLVFVLLWILAFHQFAVHSLYQSN